MTRGPAILLLAACGFAACATPSSGSGDTLTGWSAAFPEDLTRTWVGADFWANRLADWRVHDGRLECVEGARRFPLRTLMLLTREAEPGGRKPLRFEVITAPLDTPALRDADREAGGTGAFSGFLIGAGGPDVDYRITAQVHHRPAEDGGLLAVAGSDGMVQLYDNSRGVGSGGAWSIGGPLRLDELRPYRSAFVVGDGRARSTEPLRLVLEVQGEGDGGYRLQLSAFDLDAGSLLSMATLNAVQPEVVRGMVGLVSHLGGDGSADRPGRGHWFDDWRVDGGEVIEHDTRAWGPVLAAQYTVSQDVLKLTAQCPPLDSGDPVGGTLSVRPHTGGPWRAVASAELQPDSWTLPFRVEGWTARGEHDFRIRLRVPSGGGYVESHEFLGTIAAEPDAGEELVVASLNCSKHFVGNLKWNGDSIWFPHVETAAHVASLEPDLLYFAGDQLYEGDIDPVDARSDDKLVHDYLYKWYRWCWSFGELTRRIPTVTVPDDHDVYHGNLWGAGGRKAVADASAGVSAQDSGGYKHSARFVNVVHATQTSHLPDPVDPVLIERGITVYFTRLVWGGVDFAVLSDRMFKDSASALVPEGGVKNGWFENASFDPREADVDGAQLLGTRQEVFLAAWARDWQPGTWAKAVLSQTPFVNVATIPEEANGGGVLPSVPVLGADVYPDDYKFAADTDSGGWPQAGRDRAVSEMRRCFAIHLAGDQHLGTLVQYGVDAHRDGGFVFTSPAIANTWPRRWWPPIHGENAEPGAPHYTGDFVDGFGNPMTVWAAANPVVSGVEPSALYDRAPGYGIVRFQPESRAMVFECWPRWVDPLAADAWQYEGWPRTVRQFDNALSVVGGALPEVAVPDRGGVVEVWSQTDDGSAGVLIYSLPVDAGGFAAPVRDARANYVIVVRPWKRRAESLRYVGLRVGGPSVAGTPLED